MMNNLWFERELLPSEGVVEYLAKELAEKSTLESRDANKEVRKNARGILRVDKPRWDLISPDQIPLKSGSNSRFYIVRLGYQFDVPRENYDKGVRFVYARCEARIWAKKAEQPNPSVFEMIPKDLYDGEPKKVKINLGPEIKFGEVGASAASVSWDVMVGTITPAVVGWPGTEERAPYWELRPVTNELRGTHNLWLIIEVPEKCEGARLATFSVGDVQTKFGPIALGPKEAIWGKLPSIVIE